MLLSEAEVAIVQEYLNDQPHQTCLTIPIAVVGSARVGKHGVTQRLVGHELIEQPYDPTLEVVIRILIKFGERPLLFEGTSIRIGSGVAMAGDGDSGSIQTPGYCYEACILAYDVTNRSSFEDMKGFRDQLSAKRDIEEKASRTSSFETLLSAVRGPLFVFANKTDYDVAQWTVSRKEGEDFSAYVGAWFLSVSAKTGEGMVGDGGDDAGGRRTVMAGISGQMLLSMARKRD